VARRYDFAIRHVAAALCRLGEGMPYREAGAVARGAIGRYRSPRFRIPSNEGTLTAGWAEVFTDPIFDELDGCPDWPEILLLDTLPFRLKGGRGGQVAFSVFGALGWAGSGEHRIWRLWASHRQRHLDWEEFLTTGPQGMPRIIVCDADAALFTALRNLWGLNGPTVVLCHYHVEKALRERLLRAGFGPGDQLYDEFLGAFSDSASWAAWLGLARRIATLT
jgi:hypothetical protein